MRLLRLVLLLCALVCAITVFASGPLPDTEYDDCDANFIAFIGSSAYQFAPGHQGVDVAAFLLQVEAAQKVVRAGSLDLPPLHVP